MTHIVSMNAKAWALLLVLLAILAPLIWGTWPVFARFAGEMSIHGWIALAAGTVVSLALGGGLMALSFYSARRGFDDNVATEDDGENDRPT